MKKLLLTTNEITSIVGEEFLELNVHVKETKLTVLPIVVDCEEIIADVVEVKLNQGVDSSLFENKLGAFSDDYVVENDSIYIPIEDVIYLIEKKMGVKLSGIYDVFEINLNNKFDIYVGFDI